MRTLRLRQSAMPLQYLEFDLSEDGDGAWSASALACPAAPHTPALLAEVQALLQALHSELGPCGALEDGHAWDLDLQIETEDGQLLAPDALVQAPPSGRLNLSLHLAGGQALQQTLQDWIDT